MSIVVVDTDVVSFLFRGGPLGESYVPLVENRQAVTARSELHRGARRAR